MASGCSHVEFLLHAVLIPSSLSCSATLNLGETISVGGQLEWDAAQRELVGRRVLAEQPLDFHANKDVAVSVASQLGIPQLSQRVLREAFGGTLLPLPILLLRLANAWPVESALAVHQAATAHVQRDRAQPCVSTTFWMRTAVSAPKKQCDILTWGSRCSHRCVRA